MHRPSLFATFTLGLARWHSCGKNAEIIFDNLFKLSAGSKLLKYKVSWQDRFTKKVYPIVGHDGGCQQTTNDWQANIWPLLHLGWHVDIHVVKMQKSSSTICLNW
jgi:hypothetical protein